MNKQLPISSLLETLTSNLTEADIITANILSNISFNITTHRKKLKMNQKQFAGLMGVTQGMVSKWENGDYNFTIETLINIFDKLDININISFDESRPLETNKSDNCIDFLDYHQINKWNVTVNETIASGDKLVKGA